MLEYQSFTATNGTLVLTADNSFEIWNDPDTDTLLERIDGWDDGIKVYTTAPKGIGNGSYLVNSRVAEREVTAVMQFRRTEQQLKAIIVSIKKAMLSDVPFTLTRTQNSIDDTYTQTEMLEGRLKGYKWNPNGMDSNLEITFLCLDPEQEITTVTPEDLTGTTIKGI